MDGRKLQDRIHLALGRSARIIGQSADAFRPRGPFHPLNKQNRFLRLPARFISSKSGTSGTNVYGDSLWHGIFDASYTCAGDYVVSGVDTFFIASQASLQKILCVKANRTISIARPKLQTSVAGNAYGGYTISNSIIVMDRWPASVLGENRSGSSGVDLPTDQTIPYWIILLPSVAQIILSPGDIISDDLGRTAIVVGSELTDLGWRINAKMAMT